MRLGMLLVLSATLFSCGQPQESIENSSLVSHNYEEIEGLAISWEGFFLVPEPHYFVYVYLPGCMHCESIKDIVITFALDPDNPPLCFIEAFPEIPRGTDASKTIGVSSFENVFVTGWPTLFTVSFGVIENHIAGAKMIRLALS